MHPCYPNSRLRYKDDFHMWVKSNVTVNKADIPKFIQLPTIWFEGDNILLRKKYPNNTEEYLVNINGLDKNQYNFKNNTDSIYIYFTRDIDITKNVSIEINRYDITKYLSKSDSLIFSVNIIPRPYLPSTDDNIRIKEIELIDTHKTFITPTTAILSVFDIFYTYRYSQIDFIKKDIYQYFDLGKNTKFFIPTYVKHENHISDYKDQTIFIHGDIDIFTNLGFRHIDRLEYEYDNSGYWFNGFVRLNDLKDVIYEIYYVCVATCINREGRHFCCGWEPRYRKYKGVKLFSFYIKIDNIPYHSIDYDYFVSIKFNKDWIVEEVYINNWEIELFMPYGLGKEIPSEVPIEYLNSERLLANELIYDFEYWVYKSNLNWNNITVIDSEETKYNREILNIDNKYMLPIYQDIDYVGKLFLYDDLVIDNTDRTLLKKDIYNGELTYRVESLGKVTTFNFISKYITYLLDFRYRYTYDDSDVDIDKPFRVYENKAMIEEIRLLANGSRNKELVLLKYWLYKCNACDKEEFMRLIKDYTSIWEGQNAEVIKRIF